MEFVSSAESGGPHPMPSSSESDNQEMKVSLKVIKTFHTIVKRSDSINDVKAKIQALDGTSTFQEIFFQGNRMKDDKTLADCGISDGTTLNVYTSTELSVPLHVKIPPNGRILPLDLRNRDTLMTIKNKIWEKEGIPQNRQVLICSGQALPDNLPLAACNIPRNSVLNMIVRPNDALTIHISMNCGRIITLEVKSWFSVWDVKTLIDSVEHVSPAAQKLSYAGKKLDNSGTLHRYKVANESTLLLIAPMQILVRISCGNTVTLEVQRDDTVDFVKKKLREKIGTPKAQFGLVFAGRSLMDAQTLEEYGVYSGSTLHTTVSIKDKQ